MAVNLSGLPNLWAEQRRYNPLWFTRAVWLAETWWWREAKRGERRYAAQVVDRRPPAVLDWPEVAELAMLIIGRLGSYSAKAQITAASRRKRGGSRTSRLPPMTFAEQEPPRWEQLPAETWEEFKRRVFTPLHDAIFGVATQFIEDYAASRLPPIRNASEELQRRVGDVIAQSQREMWSDRQTEDALQAAGNWPLARVRTQIATETGTMYNAGRFEHMADDEAVVGYEYLVTMDEVTTDICEALDGVVVRQEDLVDIPPLHHNCRTVLEPIFEWQGGFSWTPPERLPEAAEGFGQRELVARLR
jgi:SPP1 gp7 family putative phage head morphogenesis protein